MMAGGTLQDLPISGNEAQAQLPMHVYRVRGVDRVRGSH
jgi:hypothetical protein